MCGAYGLSVRTIKDIYDRFGIEDEDNLENFKPRWNIRPGQSNPVVINNEIREIEFMLWGLIPHFAKDDHYKYTTINARAETIDQLPTFRHPFHHNRCLVPATGFYEPDKINFSKQPYPWHYFQMKDKSISSFAGCTTFGTIKTMGKKSIATPSLLQYQMQLLGNIMIGCLLS